MEQVTENKEVVKLDIVESIKGEIDLAQKQKVIDLFAKEKGLDSILIKIDQHVSSIVHDVETKKGRKEITSLANQVTKSKTYIDGIRKEIVGELKDLPKKIDAEGKRVRDRLDELRDKVRRPLDIWEAKEAERIAAIKRRIEEIKSLASKSNAKDVDYNSQELRERLLKLESIVIDESFGEFREAAQSSLVISLDRIETHLEMKILQEDQARELEILKAKQLEDERKLKEEQDKREAAERAQKEAEEKARLEKEKAEQAERAKVEAIEKAKRDEEARVQREKDEATRLEREKIEAEQRAKAEEERRLQEIEEQKIIAAENERKRIAEENRIKEEEERKRQANIQHRKNVDETIRVSLMALGLSEDLAIEVIKGASSGELGLLVINY